MSMGNIRRVLLSAIGATLVLAPAANAAEPNNDFATATGPLTAGPAFNASLETADDVDYQFFYIPDPATVTVTVKNKTAKKDATGGRTLVASLLQARKGKLPLPLADTSRTLSPQETERSSSCSSRASTSSRSATRRSTRAQPTCPSGSRSARPEHHRQLRLFARRCKDSLQKVAQYKSSKKHTAERLAKAKKAGKDRKARQLQSKLRSKRAKLDEAQRIKRFVCSVPQKTLRSDNGADRHGLAAGKSLRRRFEAPARATIRSMNIHLRTDRTDLSSNLAAASGVDDMSLHGSMQRLSPR